MRKYITDNGDEIMLPDNDERVMTLEELTAKYDNQTKPAKKIGICPKCHTYCDGDCD